MKTPTWAIVVGVLMILLGGCSSLIDYQQINTRENYLIQKDMIEKMGAAKESNPFGDMLYMSDYVMDWLSRFGYIGLVVSLLYIIAGVFLIMPKPFSIKLAYSVFVLSAAVTIIQWIVISMDDETSKMIIANFFASIFGVFIDLILFSIILSANKSAFLEQNDNEKNVA